jgi:hypothetical protein
MGLLHKGANSHGLGNSNLCSMKTKIQAHFYSDHAYQHHLFCVFYNMQYSRLLIPAGSVPLTSCLISCTPTKSNLYLASSLETVIREPPYTNSLHSTIQISYPYSMAWVVYPKNLSRSEALFKYS